jgi:gamma-glutamyltranspeptidase/glutathione hydrolase
MDILRQGGNAVDAAIATAIALGVVEPYMSGVGGVGFLLLHLAGGSTKVLNFCGNTPARATPDQFDLVTRELGPKASMIPGNVAGWSEALRAHGTLRFDQVLQPAIELADEGFGLHPFNVELIRSSLPRLNPDGMHVWGGVSLRLGACVRQPDLARTLRALASEGPDWFYQGPFARQLERFMQEAGGLMTAADLAGYRPDWEEPIEARYRGHRVRTCPPNNEGFQILQTLRLLEPENLAALEHNSAEYLHLVTEAAKLAIADRIAYAGDPRLQPVPVDWLLSPDYIAHRRGMIQRTLASRSEGERWNGGQSLPVVPPGSQHGSTTHLSVVDEAGNVASITQSLGHGFGSGCFVPRTGVALNSFCYWCEIDPACPTPNLMAPGKRWAACMAPVQVFHEDGRFWFAVSTPGSYGILHTTLQMLLNVMDFGADLQAAIDAPRFRLFEGTRMQIETRVPANVLQQLSQRGHHLELIGDYNFLGGGGQGVMIDPECGTRLAGADPRRDGYALAW